MLEESRRELLEGELNNGLAKLHLAGLRRFVKLLTNQLIWYGVPYEFKRLPSTKCPVCGHELRQLLNWRLSINTVDVKTNVSTQRPYHYNG